MKELSIEEKAKHYDGLIERLKDLKFAYRFSSLSDTIEENFLELTESEDEPKFKVGDWIVSDVAHSDYRICKIIKIENGCYTIESIYGYKGYNIFEEFDNIYHLWTIQDAKDGDALVSDYEGGICITILKSVVSSNEIEMYCHSVNSELFIAQSGFSNATWHPATKEQRDLLFQKMKEASYEWDTEKKELKKIEQKPTEDVDLPEFESYLCLMLQKFRTKGTCTNGEIIDYVKEHSQKLRDILVKPVWSEEDERMYRELHNLIYSAPYCDSRKELSCWLESIKDRVQPQNTWKPSDEQMNSFDAVLVYNPPCSNECRNHLITLYDELKKLREE